MYHKYVCMRVCVRVCVHLGAIDRLQARAGGVRSGLEQGLRLAQQSDGDPVVALLPVRLRQEAVAQGAVEGPTVYGWGQGRAGQGRQRDGSATRKQTLNERRVAEPGSQNQPRPATPHTHELPKNTPLRTPLHSTPLTGRTSGRGGSPRPGGRSAAPPGPGSCWRTCPSAP